MAAAAPRPSRPVPRPKTTPRARLPSKQPGQTARHRKGLSESGGCDPNPQVGRRYTPKPLSEQILALCRAPAPAPAAAPTATGGASHSLATTADGAVWSWGAQWRRRPVGPRRRAGPVAAGAGRGLGWAARHRCVGWTPPHPRQHRRRRRLELGLWIPRPARPRRPGAGQFEPKKIEVWASRPPTPASSDGEDNSDGEDSDLDE